MSPNYPRPQRRTTEAMAQRMFRRRRGVLGLASPSPTVPEAMAILRAYVLDSTSGIERFPEAPADTEAFVAALADLEAEIPSHKWGKLDRMRDIVRHYDVPIDVHSETFRIYGGHQ